MDKIYAFESVMDFLSDDSVKIGKPVTEAMRKADRDKLPDSAFALPKKRKYPINDEASVRNGIKYFRFVPEEDMKQCADNLYKAAKKFGIEITVTKGNPFVKYHPDVKVVPPTRKDKVNRVVPKNTDVTDVQDEMKKEAKKKKAKKATESFSFFKKNTTSFPVKDAVFGDLTLESKMIESKFSSGQWYVTLHKDLEVRLFGNTYKIPFTFIHNQMKKSDYSEEILHMAAAIPSKPRASYRKVVDGWMKTSSFNAKIKSELKEDKESMILSDENPDIGLNKDADFAGKFKPGYIYLYPNGTMLFYIEEFGSEDGYMFELAPKFEMFDGADTIPLKIAGFMDPGDPEIIRQYYEENKKFLQ